MDEVYVRWFGGEIRELRYDAIRWDADECLSTIYSAATFFELPRPMDNAMVCPTLLKGLGLSCPARPPPGVDRCLAAVPRPPPPGGGDSVPRALSSA